MASARHAAESLYSFTHYYSLLCLVKCLNLFLVCIYGAGGIRLRLGVKFLIGRWSWYLVLVAGTCYIVLSTWYIVLSKPSVKYKPAMLTIGSFLA